MKKTFLGFGLVLSLSLVAGAVAVATRDTPHAAQAASYTAYTTSTLPKNIDLNDTSEADIRSYYSGLNSLSATERQGTNLLKNLKPILKNGQKYFSYDSSSPKKAIWQAYEIVDRDWEKSPASSISGYNSTTNKISNYSYGTSTSSKGTNPYLHALYVNRNVDNQTTAWDDHNAGQWSINQEHIWAKAEGFDAEGAGGARGDLMHLWAGNGKINQSVHSNYYYAYVDTTRSYTNGSTYFSNVSGNLMGYSKTLGGSTTVFEPQDADKGDIARACFYMVARYNYYSGSDSDGIDSNNPNLVLTNLLTDWSQNGYTSSISSTGKMGVLQDLLEWNRLDPPDEWEKHRNNLLYNNYTFNRNPFIDFPEWAEFIWGKSVDGSYSTTSTGVATPASDVISDFSTTPSGSVTISQSEAEIKVGETLTLTASSSDSSAITWSTSNADVASVSGGVVTGVSAGKATITASATIGENVYSASCEVTVEEPEPIHGTVSISMSSASIYEGSTITLTATTSDSSEVTWSSSAPEIAKVENGLVTGVSAGTATITASATIYEEVCQDTCAITVTAKPDESPTLTGITLNTTGVKKSFEEGSDFTYEGLIVNACYSDGSSKQVTPKSVSSPNMSLLGTQTIEVTYSEGDITKKASYQIVINKKAVPVLSAACSKDFLVGETITKADLLVKEDNEAITDYEFEDYRFKFEDAASGGAKTEKTFLVKKGDSSCLLTVWVSRAQPSDDPSSSNLGNLIMFKDSDWMNEEDWARAIALFESLSKEERATFLTSEDYVIKQASARLIGALAKSGKSLVIIDGDYIIVEGVTATCNKTFYVGDTIKKSDISVKTKDDKPISEFEFQDYQFTIDDAVSGGNPTQKSFTIESGFSSCTLSVTVSRKAATNADTAADLANFLMYKDKDQMTDSDWTEAIRRFNAMTKEERLSFMTNSDYVTKLARTRFVSELSARGKPVYTSNGDYQISGSEREEAKQGGIPNLYLYIAIGAGALLVLVVVIIILVHSKKARKVAKKAVKKAIKSSTKKKK